MSIYHKSLLTVLRRLRKPPKPENALSLFEERIDSLEKLDMSFSVQVKEIAGVFLPPSLRSPQHAAEENEEQKTEPFLHPIYPLRISVADVDVSFSLFHDERVKGCVTVGGAEVASLLPSTESVMNPSLFFYERESRRGEKGKDEIQMMEEIVGDSTVTPVIIFARKPSVKSPLCVVHYGYVFLLIVTYILLMFSYLYRARNNS